MYMHNIHSKQLSQQCNFRSVKSLHFNKKQDADIYYCMEDLEELRDAITKKLYML
jgi:hypothetical protein